MTSFRHLDYGDDVLIDELGPAALDDLLDRGDLQAWAPLLRRIAQDPDGPLAATVLDLCDAHPMYGTSRLWRNWIERRRSSGRHGHSAADGLGELRRRRRLTQTQVADRLGISQSDVSKLERRPDLRLSTLGRYVTATGGRLRLEVRYPAERVELRNLPPPSG
ncbi:MAG: helix-turn-helix domain-containing protein [Egibacteraceae bacterium]